MPLAARLGDMHICPLVNPNGSPHIGGPILPGANSTVIIEGLPASCLGDQCTCAGPPDVIIAGSSSVLIGGKPAARMGDSSAHGGSITIGAATVLIGG